MTAQARPPSGAGPVAGALSVLLSWYYRPYLAAGNQTLGLSEVTPFFPGLFDLRGVAATVWLVRRRAI